MDIGALVYSDTILRRSPPCFLAACIARRNTNYEKRTCIYKLNKQLTQQCDGLRRTHVNDRCAREAPSFMTDAALGAGHIFLAYDLRQSFFNRDPKQIFISHDFLLCRSMFSYCYHPAQVGLMRLCSSKKSVSSVGSPNQSM